VHVTAADAGLFDMDADIMLIAELWDWALLKRDVLD
jgi:hypothetical protein